jgi:hypothetical protein
MPAPLNVRRIITGHKGSKAVFTDDQSIEPVTLALMPGLENYELWSTDPDRVLPYQVGQPTVPSYFPGADGSVMRIVTFPPDGTTIESEGFDFGAALEEAAEKMPGAIEHFEVDNPGMHTTDSVDYAICLAGEVVLDDGAERTVTPGTVVVQRGTRHAWRNRTSEPAMVAFVLLGATRE